MKNFLAIYLGADDAMSGWNQLSEAARAERAAAGMQAWQDWATRNAAAIVDPGGPLGRTRSASPAGIADVRNAMCGYTIVRAESHEAAVRMFEGHPHFSIFPGSGVEVMECLPIPGQA